ncbi:MAG: hypothetical protein SGJ24_04315 [Chloroflexota bacterium]|nr:hypothetical protein [Chloroflexota bacterium]
MRRITIVLVLLLIGSSVILLFFGAELADSLRRIDTTALNPIFGLYATPRAWLGRAIAESGILLLVAGAMTLLARRRMASAADILARQPLRSGLIGIGAWLTFPVIFIVIWMTGFLVFTLWTLEIDALASSVGGAVNTLATVIAATIVIVTSWIGRLVVGATITRWLLRRVAGREHSNTAMVIGALLVGLLASIPAIGWVIVVVMSIFGTGALLATLTRFDTPRYSIARLPGALDEATPRLPPPIASDRPSAPGMDDLPSGFTWWE